MLLLVLTTALQLAELSRAKDLNDSHQESLSSSENQISDFKDYKPHVPSIINGKQKKLSNFVLLK